MILRLRQHNIGYTSVLQRNEYILSINYDIDTVAVLLTCN